MKENLEINGKNITIVGTAHISQESRDEVRDTIETVRPDLVAVELDQSRFDSLRDDSGWKDLEISEAIREGKGNLLLLNLILSIYQRKLGLEEGMKPGAELMAAVDRAEEMDIEYALVDQDINKTLNRAISSLSILDKLRLVASMILPSDEEEMDIESLKDGDMLGTLIQELEDEFPELKRVFLDERNFYMAEKLLEKEFDSAVVVVGAAHVEGLLEELKKEKRDFSAEEVNRLPWMKITNYGFTALVFLGLGFSFYSSFAQGINNLGIWIGANSILAMNDGRHDSKIAPSDMDNLLYCFSTHFSKPCSSRRSGSSLFRGEDQQSKSRRPRNDNRYRKLQRTLGQPSRDNPANLSTGKPWKRCRSTHIRPIHSTLHNTRPLKFISSISLPIL